MSRRTPPRTARAELSASPTLVPGGCATVCPTLYDLSWERYPLTQIAQDPVNTDSCARSSASARYPPQPRRGQRPLADGSHRHRQDDTWLHDRRRREPRATLVLSFNAVALLNRIRRHSTPTVANDRRGDRDARERRAAAHRGPARRAPNRVGAGAALPNRQRPLRGQRSIVFTSDIDSDAMDRSHRTTELEEHIGKRTFSRLMEICSDPVVIAATTTDSTGMSSAPPRAQRALSAYA